MRLMAATGGRLDARVESDWRDGRDAADVCGKLSKPAEFAEEFGDVDQEELPSSSSAVDVDDVGARCSMSVRTGPH